MSTYCYLCLPSDKDTETYFICNNCGGAICLDHGGRDLTSKNAWCHDCVPPKVATAARQVAAGLDQIDKASDSPSALIRTARDILQGLLSDSTVTDLSDLATLLRAVARELDRAALDLAGDNN